MKIKSIILFFILLTVPNLSYGAIAYDSSSKAKANGVTSLTFSHTVNSNTNGILIVGIDVESATTQITGVTYAGTAMTAVTGYSDYRPFSSRHAGMFYLVAPASGANNVVITLNASSGAGLQGIAISYTGVDQTIPINVTGDAAFNPSATITKSVTTTVNNTWLVGFTLTGNVPSAGANTLVRQGQVVNDQNYSWDSNGARATGANALTATQTSSYGAIWLCAISPSSGTPPPTTQIRRRFIKH